MTPENLLRGAALIELVGRQGGSTCDLDDHISLIGDVCDHHRLNLYLAGLICHIASETGFDLGSFLEAERRDALAVDPPGGCA